MKSNSLCVMVLAFFSQSIAYCPPTGSVLPPPLLEDYMMLARSLEHSLQTLTSFSAGPLNPGFNVSTTSFSIQVTSPDASFFEFHRTAPIRESSGVPKVDGDTIYRVASLSKLITSYAVLTQNHIDSEDSITNYVPELLGGGRIET